MFALSFIIKRLSVSTISQSGRLRFRSILSLPNGVVCNFEILANKVFISANICIWTDNFISLMLYYVHFEFFQPFCKSSMNDNMHSGSIFEALNGEPLRIIRYFCTYQKIASENAK